MPYPIINSVGTTLATIQDGTVNNSTTSLTLIGKNYAGYGNFLNENFVYLLENFSDSTAPVNPITGQLWYDNFNQLLKLYTGSQWKPISSSQAAATAPSNHFKTAITLSIVLILFFVYLFYIISSNHGYRLDETFWGFGLKITLAIFGTCVGVYYSRELD